MNKFIDYLKNGTLTESDKNWKAIAQKFDTIEKVEILKDGKTIKVIGKKSNKASEEEVEYKNAAVAKEVKNKLLYLIGIKEDDNLDESLKVGDTVELDVDAIMKSEFIYQFPGKQVPTEVKIITPKVNTRGDFTFELPKYKGKEATLPKKFIKLDEAAVGQRGRTSYKEAEEYCEENEELVAEFRKIVKKLGGKTVAKALLDKLSQKPEIKDEIDNIEDIVDNSNY